MPHKRPRHTRALTKLHTQVGRQRRHADIALTAGAALTAAAAVSALVLPGAVPGATIGAVLGLGLAGVTAGLTERLLRHHRALLWHALLWHAETQDRLHRIEAQAALTAAAVAATSADVGGLSAGVGEVMLTLDELRGLPAQIQEAIDGPSAVPPG